jgi:hypothetical protein
MVNPTVAQTAAALNGVRKSGTEEAVNAFLNAVERHYGTDHMRAAHALAHDLYMEESGAVRDSEGHWTRPAPYKLIGREVGQYVGGMYRFYCYLPAWAISPAAQAGHSL